MSSALPSVTALILAGGQSTRFGADKARHDVGGQMMIERVYEAVEAVARRVVLSVETKEAIATFPFEKADYVVDHYPGAGPLAGLHAGLRALRTPWLLAVACDMPFLTGAALRQLAFACSPEVAAVVARDAQGRRHPLCACYHKRVTPLVEAQLEAGQFALQALLDRLGPVASVPLPDADLQNINTNADLLRAKRIG